MATIADTGQAQENRYLYSQVLETGGRTRRANMGASQGGEEAESRSEGKAEVIPLGFS